MAKVTVEMYDFSFILLVLLLVLVLSSAMR